MKRNFYRILSIISVIILVSSPVCAENATLDKTGTLHIPVLELKGFDVEASVKVDFSLNFRNGTFSIISAELISDGPTLLRKGDYTFKRDLMPGLADPQYFYGDYKIYDEFMKISVRKKESDWTMEFARWIFGQIISDGKVYQITRTASDTGPSKIYLEYVELKNDEYGYPFFHFKLHFPATLDASYAIELFPTSLMTENEWSPESIKF